MAVPPQPEFAFDAAQLQAWAVEKLAACDVEVNLNHRVESCRADGGGCAVDIVPTGSATAGHGHHRRNIAK